MVTHARRSPVPHLSSYMILNSHFPVPRRTPAGLGSIALSLYIPSLPSSLLLPWGRCTHCAHRSTKFSYQVPSPLSCQEILRHRFLVSNFYLTCHPLPCLTLLPIRSSWAINLPCPIFPYHIQFLHMLPTVLSTFLVSRYLLDLCI
jgi:hypothetical protein